APLDGLERELGGTGAGAYPRQSRLILGGHGHLRMKRSRKPQPRRDSPPPCGEGLGMGGLPPFDVLQSPPPWPSSPPRGEGTLRLASRSISNPSVLAGERRTILDPSTLTSSAAFAGKSSGAIVYSPSAPSSSASRGSSSGISAAASVGSGTVK